MRYFLRKGASKMTRRALAMVIFLSKKNLKWFSCAGHLTKNNPRDRKEPDRFRISPLPRLSIGGASMPEKIKETPQNAKELFYKFLFPCKDNKHPDISAGESWLFDNKDKKPIVRSIEKPLCGVDCGHAGLIVVDIDSYKKEFKESKHARDFYKLCLKKSQFKYKTPSGGWHIFFKGQSKSFDPYPGVEIKARGKYICLYDHPAKFYKYEDWTEFYKDLPEFNFKEWGKEQKDKRHFGPGKNNKAIPHRAGKAGAHADFQAMEKDLAELLFNNRNNTHDLKKHIADYAGKFKRSMLDYYTPKKTKIKIQEIGDNIQKEISFLKTTKLTKKDIKKPLAFMTDFLLDNEFNFLGGPTKLGKSRAMISMLATKLQSITATGLILSTENDQKTMMAPLLKELDAFNSFNFINDNVAKYFPKEAQHGPDKSQFFVKRIWKILKENESRCLLIDPLPRFFDWNNEVTVTTFIDGLRQVAKDTKNCIIGIRNDGKEKNYEDVHKTKGSSALVDIARQILRAIPCHRRSALGKENKKEKSFVIFTERSGLFKEVAFLFKMEVRDQGDFKVAVPTKVRQLNDDIETIKYLCTRESGQTLSNKIVIFIKRRPEKGCTLEDLFNEFGDVHSEDTIKKTVYRNFDHKKVSGITYIQLKN